MIPTPPTPPDLHAFFQPRGIAIIGASATPGKLGYSVVANLVQGHYPGHIYPVNPHATRILDLPCYTQVADVPDPVDLAVIIIPAPHVPAALEACGQRGIRAANILSGGFAEAGDEGIVLQDQLLAIARRYHMRLIGPNCVGTIDAWHPLNATFIEQMPDPGAIAFFSQSGAVGGAMIDWGKGQYLGLSHFASLGNAIDVDESDLIAFLADDEHVRVFTLYLEGLSDGRKLMQTAAAVSRRKPIIVLKVGATSAGARAVASHTAHLAGTAAAFEAAFRQSGILSAETTSELFAAALALAYQQPPSGNRIAILTNAGGPGAIAADALARNGLSLPEPDPATHAQLRAELGPGPQLRNPIDMLGAASTTEYETAARILLASLQYDAVLAILVPNAVNDPAGVADGLARACSHSTKPLYACYMGDVSIREGLARLHHHRIPAYAFPEDAARAFRLAWQWRQWLDTPPAVPVVSPQLPPSIHQRLREAPPTLGERELYPLLQDLHIPLPAYGIAHSATEAVQIAETIARPVALKILSPHILHKSDAGGVRLHLQTPAEITAAYQQMLQHVRQHQPQAQINGVMVQSMAVPGHETIIGMQRDPTFGPLIMFGGGGILVEALHDVAFGIAPLSDAQARSLIAQTATGRLLGGYRQHPPADINALVALIHKIAALALAFPQIEQLEFNPVIAHPQGQGVTVVDARAILST
ncbi:MAG: acetate--CoA ligase family protein [Chloroflexi bacterium]|nr:acetate--CoA ligase family protein [Chloroflexota bacterium]